MVNETNAPTVQSGESLSKVRLEGLLARLAPKAGQTGSSVYVAPGELQGFLSSRDTQGQIWRERLAELGNNVLKSDTGIVALQAGEKVLAIIPPFPILDTQQLSSWDTGPLMQLLAREYTVGVVLLRLGRYSVAVYRGRQLLSSKTDARYVKGRHHAGGTSQLRFQRVREGQIRRIYDKACQVARTQLAPYARQLDHILLGGEQFTLNGFLKVCPFLGHLSGITLSRRLNVRDPKRDTLEEVADMLYESRVYPLRW